MIRRMPYPESFIGPMRDELTRLGVTELKTAGDVDALLADKTRTVMIVVNSMCGCAAGKARPGPGSVEAQPPRARASAAAASLIIVPA